MFDLLLINLTKMEEAAAFHLDAREYIGYVFIVHHDADARQYAVHRGHDTCEYRIVVRHRSSTHRNECHC